MKIFSPRLLVILVLIALPVWLSVRFVPHEPGDNPFLTLYQHVMPEKLMAAAHDEASPGGESAHHAEHDAAPHYLVAFTFPGLPALFDMDESASGTQLVMTNLQLYQIAAVLLILVCFSGVPGRLRTGKGDAVSRLFAGFALWVRDEMVYSAMGKERGRAFVPYFFTLFFFVLFMNLLGLVPGGATATASIFVTAALALITFASMIGGGMIAQGPIAFWKHLVPHVPPYLWLLMFVVELLGLLVKPFALMIRLFANMTGGHMVVLSFMGLIFFFAKQSQGLGYAASPVAVAFAVFIMIIESFVALLQAYIFTMLSIIFVNSSLHPEH